MSTNLLSAAIRSDDLDAALKLIQDALGITTGDVAATFFSGADADWKSLSAHERGDLLADYLRTEIQYAVPA